VGPGREVSAVVTARDPIVSERPMYFSYQGQWDGGHTSAGMSAPARHLTFAEGYTGPGFAEFLTILNPTDAAAHVSLTYLLNGGGTAADAVTVPPHARATVDGHPAVP